MTMTDRLKRLTRDEAGSSTIESVLWMPVFIAFLCLVADASFLFYGKNQAYRLVQDANRRLSVGRMESAEEVEEFLGTALAGAAPNAVIDSEVDTSTGTVTTVVNIPASDLVATGMFTSLVKASVTVGASHFIEY